MYLDALKLNQKGKNYGFSLMTTSFSRQGLLCLKILPKAIES